MGKEMAGSDNRELDELIPLAKVGEVASSFGEGKTDIIDVRRLDFEQAINEFARRSCIPSAEIYKNSSDLKNNPLEATKHVEVSPAAMLMVIDTETAVVAEIAKLQTAEENLKLSPKQKEVFEGVKENQKGAWGFISSMAEAIKDPVIRRKVILGTVAGLEVLGLAGCAIKGPAVIPAETAFPTEPPIVQTAEAPNQTGTEIPVGNETEAPNEAKVRLPVVAEDVKNVEPSVAIGVDQTGNLIGLPAETTPNKKDEVKAFYDALLERFPGSTVYYDEDTGATGQWILYAISPENTLYSAEVSYAGGPAQLADYPVTYDGSSGTWKVSGEYRMVDIPGGELGVIWKNGFPQFLADKTTLSDGTSYFMSYMVYTTYEGINPWNKVDNVLEGTPVATSELYTEMSKEEMDALDLHGYGIEVDTKVEGLDTKFYIVTSDALMTKMAEFGYGPLKLNPNMSDPDFPLTASERVGRMLRLADYLGYMQDQNLNETNYTFDQYIDDLKDGKDRSYVIFYLNDKIVVDPTKNKELVFVYDMDFKNGFFNFKTGPYTQIGYGNMPNGDLRLINVLTEPALTQSVAVKFNTAWYQDKKQIIFPAFFIGTLDHILLTFSFSEKAQQGKAIDGDPFYVNNIFDKIKTSTLARKEMVTISQAPFASANPDNPYFSENVFIVDSLTSK